MLSNKGVNVTLPQFEPAVVHECWICDKFSNWLETKHPKLWNDWHKGQFHASYYGVGNAHVAQPGHRLLCLFMMNITAHGHSHDDDACLVDVSVIPAEGMSFLEINDAERGERLNEHRIYHPTLYVTKTTN